MNDIGRRDPATTVRDADALVLSPGIFIINGHPCSMADIRGVRIETKMRRLSIIIAALCMSAPFVAAKDTPDPGILVRFALFSIGIIVAVRAIRPSSTLYIEVSGSDVPVLYGKRSVLRQRKSEIEDAMQGRFTLPS